jgi:hypothetical protein
VRALGGPIGPCLLLLAFGAADGAGVTAAVGSIVVNLTCPPGGVLSDPNQRAMVGTRCEVHHGEHLRLGLVPIHYGLVTIIPGRNDPGERRRFPNAWPWAGGGCVIGPQRFTEVAYCRECRLAYEWDSVRRVVTAALTWGGHR